MCGILGIIGKVDEANFRHALDLMRHRGPDDSGVFHKGNFHMGFRRLSIIDLSREANQPMFSEDGRFGILFNGEIYNFREIRDELLNAGHSFTTTGDTEVILRSFKQWGTGCFKRFNGMFSIAIFDFVNEEVTLARDRLGIKPLYFHNFGDCFGFSSEIKSLVHLSDEKFELNLDSLCSYFCFRYPVSGETLFSGIHSFPAGSWMRVKDSEIIEQKKYWELKYSLNSSMERDPATIVSEIRRLLEESIERRMVSDVPIGAYLSGGVDSSAVAAIMASKSESKLNTYTIGFEEEGYNEFRYSRMVSELYDTNHTEITLDSEGYLSTMEELIRIRDSPLGVPNEVPLFIMSKRLKEDITVVLSGEGADEIFGGYGRIFRSSEDLELIEKWKERGYALDSELDHRLEDRYGGSFESEIEMFLHLYRYVPLDKIEYLFGQKIVSDFNDGPTIETFRSVFAEAEGVDFQTTMMYVFENLHLPGLLQRLDATTMGASVEGRVPFVDHNLVEYSFRIPNAFKMRWIDEIPTNTIGADSSEVLDITKWSLKQACFDILPKEIIERKKVGFPVPLKNWFGSGSIDEVVNNLLKGRLVSSGLIEREKIEKLTSEEEQEGQNSMLLWMLINFEIFLSSYPNLEVNIN